MTNLVRAHMHRKTLSSLLSTFERVWFSAVKVKLSRLLHCHYVIMSRSFKQNKELPVLVL